MSKSDHDRHLRTDHLHADLRGRSVRGGAAAFAGQVCRFVIRLGSVAILARLLTVDDFGLFAKVISIMGFLALIKDFGLPMATVQKDEIDQEQVTKLFWINLGLSIALTTLTVLISPIISRFYGDIRVTSITIVLSANFVLLGSAAQHLALLRRQMRFLSMAGLEVVAMLISVSAGIAIAWMGGGYWSLVWQQIVNSIVLAAGAWIVTGWRPGRPRWSGQGSSVRSMLAFGGNLTGSRLINHLARNVDTILVAKYISDHAAGLYNTASSRLFIPLQQIDVPINLVAIPALSRLQNDPVRYRRYYLRAVLLMVMFGMPIVGFLFVAADKIILAVLSDKFIQAVPIFRAMAPGMFLWTFNVATAWVFISLGRTDRQLRWGIFSSSVTILAFFIGLQWGAFGVAAGFSVAAWLLRYPGVRFCYMDTPLKVRDLLGVLWRPALASIVAGFALFGFGLAVPLDINVILGLIVDAAIYGIAYVLCWLVLPKGARDLLNLVAIVREVITPPKNNNHPQQQGD